MWFLLSLLFLVPCVVVYASVVEYNDRATIRTGVGIEAAIMERVLRGCPVGKVVIESGFMPSAAKHGSVVQGLLPVVRFVGAITRRYERHDAFAALQLDAALEPLRELVQRVHGDDVPGVFREDVEFLVNTILTLQGGGSGEWLLGQERRTVVDDVWEGALEWVLAQRGRADADLLRLIEGVAWVNLDAAHVDGADAVAPPCVAGPLDECGGA